jgi:TolB protein
MRPGSIGLNPDYDLKVVDADGSHERALTKTPTFMETNPEWSPDGTRLVFRRGPVGRQGAQVWSIAADGTHLMQLTEIGGFGPAWSPDGERIVFVEPAVDAHVMNPDGSGIIDLGLGATVGFVSWGR